MEIKGNRVNFEYNAIKVPEGHMKISPSQIAKFFNYPSLWYKDNFTDAEGFTGNTATELGTIVHACAETVALNETVNRDEIDDYIDSIDNEDVDKAEIRKHWYEMSHLLINEYVLKNVPDLVEHSTQLDLGDKISLAGTLDSYYNNGVVTDYKTKGSKPKTDAIPWEYWVQLMAYAKMLKEEGKEVNRLRIVWIVKPTKTLPARLFVVNHEISDKDWKEFDDVLTIMVDTIKLTRSNPEYIHILYKSMNLKDN